MLYFTGKNPLLVFTITLSNTMNIDGNTKMTTIILMIAPLAINIHNELIISIFDKVIVKTSKGFLPAK